MALRMARVFLLDLSVFISTWFGGQHANKTSSIFDAWTLKPQLVFSGTHLPVVKPCVYGGTVLATTRTPSS